MVTSLNYKIETKKQKEQQASHNLLPRILENFAKTIPEKTLPVYLPTGDKMISRNLGRSGNSWKLPTFYIKCPWYSFLELRTSGRLPKFLKETSALDFYEPIISKIGLLGFQVIAVRTISRAFNFTKPYQHLTVYGRQAWSSLRTCCSVPGEKKDLGNCNGESPHL